MTRPRVVGAVGLLGPLLAVAILVPFRDSVANTNAALLLVLLVVAVAALGDRRAGVLAAVSSGVWFDFFLTQPYQRFAITKRGDLETTVLLLAVGVAVTELAVWGRRRQAEVSRLLGYEEGIRAATESISDGASTQVVIAQVCEQLCRVLGLRECRFDYGAGVFGGNHPRLRPDGQVEVEGVVCDVERLGLPMGHDIELLLMGEAGYRGRFVMKPNLGARPTLEQRLAAVTLAARANAALVAGRAT